MKFNAILLAGGLSTRMGRDKAMLTQHGITLLHSAYSKATAALKPFEGRVLVSGHYLDYSGIADIKTGRGPIEGIWSCTRKIECDSTVLVFPVDMPLLTTEQFKLLFELFEQECIQKSGVEFIQFKNWEMPFIFIYNAKTEKILGAIRDTEVGSKRSISYFKSQLCGKEMATIDFNSFINVNTPADWKEVSHETAFNSQ